MYISKIQVRLDALDRQAFWRLLQDGYHVHRQLWTLFADSDDRRRDFLYRQEQISAALVFFAVSERRPHDDRGLWRIETKRYEPTLKRDQRLAFVLRANPVRSRRDASSKQRRHDVVMEGKTRLKHERGLESDRPLLPEIIQREGYAWLASRAARHGFAINEGEVRIDGYRQHRWFKSGTGHQVRISTVEITGVLTVTDPERFAEALYRGLGPAKGLGCGLLMVRPI